MGKRHTDEEEEREEWDDEDRVDYEKNKKFEQLIVDIVVMKEKMEKMQFAFYNAKVVDPLPPKFKISYAEKFDRTGDPRQHVRQYISLT